MQGGPSGFHNAPVTRTVVIASGLVTVIFGVRGRALRLGLSYPEIFKHLKLWRIVASEFAFSPTPELMFGLYLLYYFRVFERQIGSNKYSVFILFSIFVSLLFEVLALMLLKDPTSIIASGPYGLIFASFVPFYLDIPVSSRFRIFGINFTNKSFLYLAGLQLLLSSWKCSLVPGICGILAGILYRVNAFRIRRIKFPKFISSFFTRLAWSSGSTSRASSSSRNVIRSLPSTAGRHVEFIPNFRIACWCEGEEQKKCMEQTKENLIILERQLKGKKFFGGDAIGLADVAGSYIAFWTGVIQKVNGVTLINEENHPNLLKWSEEYLRSDIVKESLPDREKLTASY